MHYFYRISLSLCLLIACMPKGTAQSTISGTVLDETEATVAYVNVLLLNASDSTLVKGEVTLDDGTFLFDALESGTYLVQASMIGYANAYSQLISANGAGSETTLPPLVLTENIHELAEAEIVAQKVLFEQKVDRLVVNVGSSVTLAGTSALEVLKRSPGVTVDPQSSLISMNGKTGVIVMINDRITRMPIDAVLRMLDGMNSDQIERVELIHTPPARYEAQGNAGFINIVLKENPEEGFNGGMSLKAGYGRKEKAGGSFNFNYRKNIFNLYGDYSYDRNNTTQLFTNYREFESEGTFFQTQSDSDRDPALTQTHIARLGFDLDIGEKTVLGILGSYTATRWDMDAVNEVEMLEDSVVVQRILIPNTEVNNTDKYLINLNFNHSITPTQNINFDLDYNYFWNDNPSSYKNQYYDENGAIIEETGLEVEKTTPMDIWVGKIDYTNSSNDRLTWSTGIKGVMTRFDNDIYVEELYNGEWIFAPQFSSLAEMSEDILSAYGSAMWQAGTKTELQLGLRYEYTNSRLSTTEDPNLVDRQYGSLFPSILMSHKINEDNTFQASYARRIQRPQFRQLAPFFIFSDPSTILTGNPELQPAFSNSLRVAHQWKSVQLSLEYTYTDTPISGYQPRVDLDENTLILQPKNMISSHLVTSTLSFPLNITDWWELRTNWTLQWTEVVDEVDGEELTFDNTQWNMNGSSVFTLPKGFTIEVSGRYFSSNIAGPTRWEAVNMVDLGIQKSFPKNGSTLRFSVTDMFEGGSWFGSVNNPGVDFVYEGSYQIGERVFRLSYAQQFGKSSVKGARKRETGSAEEQRRAN